MKTFFMQLKHFKTSSKTILLNIPCFFILLCFASLNLLSQTCPSSSNLSIATPLPQYNCSSNSITGRITSIQSAGFTARFTLNNEFFDATLTSTGEFTLALPADYTSTSGVFNIVLSSVRNSSGTCNVSPLTNQSFNITIQRPLLTSSNPGIALEICRSNQSLTIPLPGNSFLNNQTSASITWTGSIPFGSQTSTSTVINQQLQFSNLQLNSGQFSGNLVLSNSTCLSPSYPITFEVQPEPILQTTTPQTICAGAPLSSLLQTLVFRMGTSNTNSVPYVPGTHGVVLDGTFSYSTNIGQGIDNFPIISSGQNIYPASPNAIVVFSDLNANLNVNNLIISGSNTCAPLSGTYATYTIKGVPSAFAFNNDQNNPVELCHGEPYTIDLASMNTNTFQYQYANGNLTGLANSATFASFTNPLSVEANNETDFIQSGTLEVRAVLNNCFSQTISKVINVSPRPKVVSLTQTRTLCSNQPLSDLFQDTDFIFTPSNAIITGRFWKIVRADDAAVIASGVSFPPNISIANNDSENATYFLYAGINTTICSSSISGASTLSITPDNFLCTLLVRPLPKIDSISQGTNPVCNQNSLSFMFNGYPNDAKGNWTVFSGLADINSPSGTLDLNTTSPDYFVSNGSQESHPLSFIVTPFLNCSANFISFGVPQPFSYTILPGPSLRINNASNNAIGDTVNLCSGGDISPSFLIPEGVPGTFELTDNSQFSYSITIDPDLEYVIDNESYSNAVTDEMNHPVFTDLLVPGSNNVKPIESIVNVGANIRDIKFSYSILQNESENVCSTNKSITYRIHPIPRIINSTDTFRICANVENEIVLQASDNIGSLFYERESIIPFIENDTVLTEAQVSNWDDENNIIEIDSLEYSFFNHLIPRVFRLNMQVGATFTESDSLTCLASSTPLRIEVYSSPERPEFDTINNSICTGARNIEIKVKQSNNAALVADSYYSWDPLGSNSSLSYSFDYADSCINRAQVGIFNAISPGNVPISVTRISKKSSCKSALGTKTITVNSNDATALSQTCVVLSPGGTGLFAINNTFDGPISYAWGTNSCLDPCFDLASNNLTGQSNQYFIPTNPSLETLSERAAIWVEVRSNDGCKSRTYHQDGNFFRIPGNSNARILGCPGSSTSISELNDNLLNLFPNPVSRDEIITISLPENINHQISTLAVYDFMGRRCLSFPWSEINSNNKTAFISVSGLVPGLYHVIIESESESRTTYTRKLLISN